MPEGQDSFSQAMQAINAGMNLFGGMLGGFAGRRDNRWFQNALIEIVDRARQGDDWARTMLQQTLDPASQAALSGINLAGNQLWGGDQLAADNQNFFNSLGNNFQQNLFNSPGIAAARARMEPLADNAAARGDVAFERFTNGGSTPEYQNIYDALQGYLTGRGSNSQIEQQNVGANLLSQRGQTAFTQGVQDRGMDALNSGGMNPYLEFALQKAAEQIQNGGMTPENAQAFERALSLISQDGETANTLAAQDKGLQKAAQDTVLPLNELRNMTGNAATSQLQNAIKDLYADAARRGGGPGVTIANGLNSAQLTDYLERAGKTRGDAEATAAEKWMEAAQRDAALGVNLFGSGGQLASNRLNQATNLFNSANSNAVNRLNTAFSAIPGTQNSATNIMQTLGQLGLGSLGAENQRIGLGGSLAQDYTSGLNAFANTYGNTATNMNNFGLGAGQLSNQFSNTGLNANNSLFGNDINAGQLNLGYGTNQSNAQNSAMNNRNNLFGQFSSNYNNGIGQLNNIASQYGDYARANIPLTGAYQAYGGGANRTLFDLTGGR